MVTSLDRALVGWSAAFIVSQTVMAKVLGPTAPRVLEVQTAWSERRYRQILDSMDSDDLTRYRRLYQVEPVHPAIFGIALYIGGRRLAQLTELSGATRAALAIAPVVSAACDYVENAVGVHLLDHPDAITDKTVRATTVVSTLKWAAGLGMFAYLAQGYLRVWGRALGARS